MSRLSRQQKEIVQQFVAITSTSERNAVAALKASNWNVELAFDLFYNSNSGGGAALGRSAGRVDTKKLEELFQRYKDPQNDLILVDGVAKLCEDLDVDPQDIVMLVFCWRFKAATMCEFSHEEFISGLQSLSASSISDLKARLPSLRNELKDEQKFREIYNYAFGWAKEKGQKSLALDTALGMWKLLLGYRGWRWTDEWCDFIQTKHNKAVSKDTWQQLFEFSRISDPTLSTYDEEGAWPYLVDEFVDHLREKEVVPRKPDPSCAP